MKQGRIYWFKDDIVTQESIPRGMIEISKCLSIKGAEDVLHREYAFELTTEGMDTKPVYFIAENEKAKEEWINAVGRAIVQHSKSLMQEEQTDYTTG